MKSAFFSLRGRTTLVPIGAVALVLTISFACGNAPAPGVGETKTPIGNSPPRTSIPMPPITAAGGAANAQSFTLLDNRRETLSDYLGKVVVLDFWATYCVPCKDAAPHLNELQKRLGDKGVIILGLNVGGPEDHPKIREFADSIKIEYALGIPEPEMMNFYLGNDDKIPQTIVFDRTGRIVKHFVGYDSTVAAQLDSTLEETLAAKQ